MAKRKTREGQLMGRLDETMQARPKPRKRKTPAARSTPAPATAGKGSKISVSVFDTDLQTIETIIRHLGDKGQRVTRSDAVKLALRTVDMDKLMDALGEIRAEDKRRR